MIKKIFTKTELSDLIKAFHVEIKTEESDYTLIWQDIIDSKSPTILEKYDSLNELEKIDFNENIKKVALEFMEKIDPLGSDSDCDEILILTDKEEGWIIDFIEHNLQEYILD